ncbi:hypothetical protein Tco_0970259 [Tanacetum coccineum]
MISTPIQRSPNTAAFIKDIECENVVSGRYLKNVVPPPRKTPIRRPYQLVHVKFEISSWHGARVDGLGRKFWVVRLFGSIANGIIAHAIVGVCKVRVGSYGILLWEYQRRYCLGAEKWVECVMDKLVTLRLMLLGNIAPAVFMELLGADDRGVTEGREDVRSSSDNVGEAEQRGSYLDVIGYQRVMSRSWLCQKESRFVVYTVVRSYDLECIVEKGDYHLERHMVDGANVSREKLVAGVSMYLALFGSGELSIKGLQIVAKPELRVEVGKVYGWLSSSVENFCETLKAQLLVKEAEAVDAIHLRTEVSKFEVVEKSLRDEANVLKEKNAALEQESTNLGVKVADLVASVKVHELETSFARLQEKVTAYEDCMGKLEEFQDEQIRVMNDKFKKLYVDFVEMALHLEEKFYPHLLTTIVGRRWLLT